LPIGKQGHDLHSLNGVRTGWLRKVCGRAQAIDRRPREGHRSLLVVQRGAAGDPVSIRALQSGLRVAVGRLGLGLFFLITRRLGTRIALALRRTRTCMLPVAVRTAMSPAAVAVKLAALCETTTSITFRPPATSVTLVAIREPATFVTVTAIGKASAFVAITATRFRWRPIAARSEPVTFASFRRRSVAAASEAVAFVSFTALARRTVATTPESTPLAPFRRRSIAASLAVESSRAAIAVARRTALTIARPASGELWTQFIGAQLAVGVGVERLESFSRFGDLVGRDLMIAVGIQRFEQRRCELAWRAAEATFRRSERPASFGASVSRTAPFAVGPAAASRFPRRTISITRRAGTISFRSRVFRRRTLAGSRRLFGRRSGALSAVGRRIGVDVGSGPGRNAAQQRGQQDFAHNVSLNRERFAQRKNSAAVR